jgi:hypothetical protein
VSISTCGGLIHGGGGLYSGGGLIFGGLWNRDWVIKPTQCYWLVGQKKPIHI